MTNDKLPKRRNRSPANTTSRLSDEQLATMGDLFPGFDKWYRETHDSDGKLLPKARIPGLQPPDEDK